MDYTCLTTSNSSLCNAKFMHNIDKQHYTVIKTRQNIVMGWQRQLHYCKKSSNFKPRKRYLV